MLKNSISYLPFYGGGKGHYLEVTKDNSGTVIKETIISENEVRNDDVVANPTDHGEVVVNQEENKNIFEKNLQSVHTSAQKILALQEIAKKSGNLSEAEKESLKAELNYLTQSAGVLASLSETMHYDVGALLGNRENSYADDNKFEENVGEEGISVEGPAENYPENENRATLAEAKPVGLAIAGEGGIASSKPVATAVVANGGIAVARPVATAIAGVDPTALGVGLTLGKV